MKLKGGEKMSKTTIEVGKHIQEELAIIKAVERKRTYNDTLMYLIDKYYSEKLQNKEQQYKV